MDVREQLQSAADRHKMFAPGQTVVVAVSGGPDSITLLHALHSLRHSWDILLVAAHLDHGFRGEESAADAEYVRAFCRALDIPARIAFENVPELKKQLHLSAQEAARRARHEFLRDVARETSAERIALGHTRDDRVETILMNILRGTGPDGLQGFPPVRLPLVRPLYEVSRSDVRAYCELHSLKPRLDPSNETTRYRRNRLRHELIPHLTAEYNSEFAAGLLRLSDIAVSENELLDSLAAEALASLLIDRTPTSLTLDTARLNDCPIALRRRILRLTISRLRGSLFDIDSDAVERALVAAESGVRLAFDLPRGDAIALQICVGAGRLSLQPPESAETPVSWSITLPQAGEVALPDGRTLIVLRCGSVNEAAAACQLACDRAGGKDRCAALLFPLAGLHLPLAARSWHSGDRMRPRGLGGSKKVQDIFVDRKIPRRRRCYIPIIVEDAPEPRAETVPHAESLDSNKILGLLGVQGGESSIPIAEESAAGENIGACVLIMALSGRDST